MTDAHHHHHHDHAHGGHAHAHTHARPAIAGDSLLRASAAVRLAGAGALIALVWAATLLVLS